MTHEQWIENIIVVPTLLLAVCSIIGDIYVVVSISRQKKSMLMNRGMEARLTHDYILCDLILWLASSNLILSLVEIPDDSIEWKNVNFLCIMTGFTSQFVFVFVSLWRIFIALNLLALLITDIQQQIVTIKRNPMLFDYITFILIIISFVAAILPLLWKNENHYGIIYNYTSNNGETYATECWVQSYFQLIGYSLLMLSVCFDIIVLLMAIYKYYQTKRFTNAYLRLIKRLSTWVGVFLLIRIFPFIERVLNIAMSDFNPPLWLVLLNKYCFASMGIANGIIWYLNRRYSEQHRQSDNLNPLVAGIHANESNENTNTAQDSSQLPTAWQSHDTTTIQMSHMESSHTQNPPNLYL